VPQLSAEDIRGWSSDRLTSEYTERLDRVRAIRDGAGGSLANVVDGQADEVRNLMADTNLIGERLDEAKQLAGLDQDFEAQASRKLPRGVTPGRPTFPIGADGPAAGADALPTDIGGRFIASEAWAAFKAEGTKGQIASLPLASLWAGYKGIGEIPAMQAALFQMSGYPSIQDFRPDPITQLYQQNNIGPLMAQGTTNAQTIRYPVETVTATGAAPSPRPAPSPRRTSASRRRTSPCARSRCCSRSPTRRSRTRASCAPT
jgi:hypothetical protein